MHLKFLLSKIVKRTFKAFNFELKRIDVKKTRQADEKITPNVLVATHHKTGTLWLRNVFSEIAEHTGRDFVNISYMPSRETEPILREASIAPTGKIFFHNHSGFPELDNKRAFLGLHMIRDPRDVILSGMHYHLKSSEKWLHQPRSKYNGKTYQEALSSLDSEYERFEFELTHAGKNAVEEMQSFDEQEIFNTVHYEDMIADTTLTRWHDVFISLGFEGEELCECLRAVWKHSLFGALKPNAKSVHLRSGQGKQWLTAYTEDMRMLFKARFPGACSDLGYD